MRGVSSPAAAFARGVSRRRRDEVGVGREWCVTSDGREGDDDRARLVARVEELERQLASRRRQLANVERATEEDEEVRARLAGKVKELKVCLFS